MPKKAQDDGKHSVYIDQLLVEFLSNKDDNYGSNVYYFKILDKDIKTKLLPILTVSNSNLFIPCWKNDENEYFLKIKEKWMNNAIMNKKDIYSLDICFESFIIKKPNQKNIMGYFIKLINYTHAI